MVPVWTELKDVIQDIGCVRKEGGRGRRGTQRKVAKTEPYNSQTEGWRDGSAVKSTDCSSKGPEFKS